MRAWKNSITRSVSIGVLVLITLTGCGGGEQHPADISRSESTQTPFSEQTQALLAKGAALNAAELKAAAKETGQAVLTTSRWPKDPFASFPSASSTGRKMASLEAPQRLKAFSAVPVYRFFNAQTAAHFYTISESERDTVRNTLPQFSYEGVSFAVSPTEGTGLSPVYRFFNTQTGVHFYSISEDEKNNILQNLSQFNFEGIAYYASKTKISGFTELGRFYVPGKGFHFYTASSMEAANIEVFQASNYRWEGFAYYVIGEDYTFGRSMLEDLNAVRVQGGFGGMSLNSALEDAAYSHAYYMLYNYHDGFSWDYQLMVSIEPNSGNLMAHTEMQGMRGFTGVNPISRAAAQGFSSSYVAEVIVNGSINYQLNTYKGCAGDLLNTVFHRDGLLGYDLREFGAAVMYSAYHTDYVCIIEPARTPNTNLQPPAGWVAVYPLPGQKGLPVSFSNEAPDPVPTSPVKGSPVTLYIAPNHQLSVTTFELRNASGALVPAKVLTKTDFPAYLGTGVAHLVPLSPLASNAKYTVNFVGADNGVPLSKTWTFGTK